MPYKVEREADDMFVIIRHWAETQTVYRREEIASTLNLNYALRISGLLNKAEETNNASAGSTESA